MLLQLTTSLEPATGLQCSALCCNIAQAALGSNTGKMQGGKGALLSSNPNTTRWTRSQLRRSSWCKSLQPTMECAAEPLSPNLLLPCPGLLDSKHCGCRGNMSSRSEVTGHHGATLSNSTCWRACCSTSQPFNRWMGATCTRTQAPHLV